MIADIGIPGNVIEALEGGRVELLTRGGMRELVTPRAADSHKGDYGHVLVVAGSRGKTGAAHLAGVGEAFDRLAQAAAPFAGLSYASLGPAGKRASLEVGVAAGAG